jgi:hypothetical protein
MFPGRTTAELVGGICTLNPAYKVDPFIDVANDMVTDVCAAILDPTTLMPAYSDHKLEQIERWLSAHFYCIRDPRHTVEEAGRGVRVQYESKTGFMFNLTRYGSTALVIDNLGGLAVLQNMLEISKGPPLPASKFKIGVTYIGGRPRCWGG